MNSNTTFDTASPRAKEIRINQIAQIADMARDDPEVIKLWIGEGDLPTPDFIKKSVMQALENNHTRYTYSLGVPELRKAISAYYKRHWNLDIAYERFSITVGGVNAIMQAFQSLIEPGDELLMPFPAWPNMVESARILGGNVVPVPYKADEDEGFYLVLEDLFAAVNERTKVIVINSPSNPTGWVMPFGDMVKLRDFVRAHGLWLISDEVYNHFIYDGTHVAHSFLEICEPHDRLIVTNTFSKNWAMTGWRAGWMIYPEGGNAIFNSLNQFNTTSIPTFIQHAAMEAVNHGDAFIEHQVARCHKARDIICEGLGNLPKVKAHKPKGAFYLLLEVETEEPIFDVAVRILKEAKVGLAPGTAFGEGGDRFLRLCFAIDPELAKEVVHRLHPFFKAL